MRTNLFAIALSTLLSACGGRLADIPAYPLYPNPEYRRPPGQVAKLVTTTNAPTAEPIVKAIDKRDVTGLDSQAFALLPGCHIVQTASNVTVATDYMAFRGVVGSRVFALKMKPGYTYVVSMTLTAQMGSTAAVSFRAEEQDPSGATTAEFEPAKSLDDIKACFQSASAPQAVPAPHSSIPETK